MEDHTGAFTTERQRTSRHLVEHRPKGEQVRACVQLLGAYLFRRHVSNGPQGRSRTSQVLRADSGCGFERHASRFHHSAAHRRNFRQPKVQNFDVPVSRQLDIRGLEIAMDDTFFVCSFQCFSDLTCNR